MVRQNDRGSAPPAPTHVRPPLLDTLSFVWVIVPLLSVGFLAPLSIGFAAYRLRSRLVAITAAGYLSLALGLVATRGIRDWPSGDWRNEFVWALWCAGPWLGGTLQGFLLRTRVFPARALSSPTADPSDTGQEPSMASWNPWGAPPSTADAPIPERPTKRVLAGPTGAAVPLSYIWAVIPLLTLGFTTSLVIGSAAVRLRSWKHGVAAAAYLVALGIFVITNEPMSKLPSTSWQYQLMLWSWSLGPWWGGTFHAFMLRQSVFRRRPAPAPTPSQVSDAIGSYRLVRRLGAGGQATVYLGVDPAGRQVAVKVIHPSLGFAPAEHEALRREIAAAQRVPPFATAPILDFGITSDHAYIVSEYIPGPSLQDSISQGGPLDTHALIRLAIATAAALRGIHNTGIVHRDFKPANVLLGPDGPRVIDFGIARVLDRVTMTSGGIKGTPAYMSPEQVSGQFVGPPSDVFSWASTMYFAATGRLAFDGPTFAAVAYQICTRPPDVRIFPPTLQMPMAACFDPNPQARPTAAQLMLALSQ
ncbi:serine/threonine-protein kinase [Nonomuraea sp. NPDC049421]|uniref:serine/threonine-protein kinase n=1 Tax=Nonomuraea sp. NPDC049421 TaxID=3155275 RepID=UPI00342BA71B